jgi:hypothetical protein
MLIYREPPDALVRLRMAEVRLRNHVALIPIPLAEVEEVLRGNACAGLLAEYANRYLPGADLFDDRLAISDTFTFFGREQLLHRLQEDLLKLQGIGLFGSRKSGKTSMLLQLGFALRHHPVVRCDLQFHGENPRFGGDLFSTILQQLTALVAARRRRLVPRFTPLAPDLPAAQLAIEFAQRVTTLAEVLQRVGYALPILCFLDEVERILPARTDQQEKVEEFNACFGVLRALSQERHILALLVADVHPDCNRINQWAQEGVASNPVYNFFKEIFLPPFSETDTTTMLTDLGRFMGRTFDEPTLQAIHRESGGHPYVARQLASLVCARMPAEGAAPVPWSAAQRYVERPFNYSDTLKNYCDEGIWGDLQKRHFTAAMTILHRWQHARRAPLREVYGRFLHQWPGKVTFSVPFQLFKWEFGARERRLMHDDFRRILLRRITKLCTWQFEGVCFLLDEAEFIVRQTWANDAWSYFRGLKDTDTALKPFLGLLLSGYRDVKEYEQRVGSPLRNIASVEWLEPLHESETRALMTHRAEDERITLSEADIVAMLAWAGGHPFLSQQMLNVLFDARQDTPACTVEQLVPALLRQHQHNFVGWWNAD